MQIWNAGRDLIFLIKELTEKWGLKARKKAARQSTSVRQWQKTGKFIELNTPYETRQN